jgi:nucleotide-binding universal stress UspA family protein
MVVVGIDQREQARDALSLARAFARVTGEGLLIAWVHPYERLPSLISAAEEARAAREAVDAIAAAMRDSLPQELRSELRTVSGRSAGAGLQGLAEREGASLVVVGPSNRAGLGRVLPGATARRLLAGSPAPVAVAPGGYRDAPGELRTIGVAFDGGAESLKALEWAASLARRADASLRVVAVFSPPAFGQVSASGAFPVESVSQALRRELREELEAAAERAGDGVEIATSLVVGKPGTVLAKQSRELDLLALGSRGYGPVRAVMLGSVSEAVVEAAACPVVITPRGGAPTGVTDADAPVP